MCQKSRGGRGEGKQCRAHAHCARWHRNDIILLVTSSQTQIRHDDSLNSAKHAIRTSSALICMANCASAVHVKGETAGLGAQCLLSWNHAPEYPNMIIPNHTAPRKTKISLGALLPCTGLQTRCSSHVPPGPQRHCVSQQKLVCTYFTRKLGRGAPAGGSSALSSARELAAESPAFV